MLDVTAKRTSDTWFERLIPAYSTNLGRAVSLNYVRYMDRFTISVENVRAASSEGRAYQRRLLALSGN
jgi:hypothetical protein